MLELFLTLLVIQLDINQIYYYNNFSKFIKFINLPESEGIPLKIIHYKSVACGGKDGFDTGIRVSEEDLRDAKIATSQSAEYPDYLYHHYIAIRLMKKFKDRIKAILRDQLGIENDKWEDWQIQNDELLQAIRRIGGQ